MSPSWKPHRPHLRRHPQPRRFEVELLEKRIALGGLLRALLAACLGTDGDGDTFEGIAPPPMY